jgi:hypothetical protein
VEEDLHFPDVLRAYEQMITKLSKVDQNVAHGKKAGMENLVVALDFLFRCHHQNLSRVSTLDGPNPSRVL